MDTEWEDGKRKESRGWEGKIKQGWVGGRVESYEGVVGVEGLRWVGRALGECGGSGMGLKGFRWV